MLTSKRNQILIPPGVDKDDNAYTTFQWADADKIRFYRSFPQKIGGWRTVTYNNTQTLTGVPRSIFSYIDGIGTEHVLIGTNTRLYSYELGSLYNITPLVTATTTIANSLSTNYNTLANNPVTTTIGTKTITLAVGATIANICRVGDFIKISGETGAVGGIAQADINGTFSISSVVGTNITYQSTSATNATSTATGGSNAVILAQRVISVNQVAHGFLEGDRIKILGATMFGGFAAGDLNIESYVRFIDGSDYAYYSITSDASGDFATSLVTGSGGGGVTVQGQIAGGTCSIQPAEGYGGTNYGTLSYGTGRPFTGGFAYPQVWSFALFNNNVLLTPGNQSGIYEWAGNINTAPVLQTAGSIPTAVNYITVMDDQIVVFGAAGVPNAITSSNLLNNWVVGPATSAFNGTLVSAGTLLSSQYCKGQHVIFTNSSVHKMSFVGSPSIWIIEDIMTSDGILGPQAATSVQDNVVWVGESNFYIYNGSNAAVIPDNTLREWFYTNLNTSTFFHSFAHKSIDFNEVWWFFPSTANGVESEEPNNYVIWNWEEGHFTNGQLTRTASEEPSNLNRYQYLATGSCDGSVPVTKLYSHEVENDYSDDGNPMTGSLTSNDNLIDTGEYMQQIMRVIPSSSVLPLGKAASGNLLFTMNILTKEYDGALAFRTFGPYNILDTTQKVEVRVNGRQRQYQFNFSNTVGFRIEKWFEELRTTTPR